MNGSNNENIDIDTNENEQEQQNTDTNTETNEKRFTQAEIDKMISARIAKVQKKHELELETAKTEAEKLANMNAEQKAKYETEKRMSELTAREKAIAVKELEYEAKSQLAEKGLPTSLSKVLNFTDADTCNDSIVALETAFKEAVEKAVESKIKGTAPVKKATGNSYTYEELENMSDEEYYKYKSQSK